MREALATRVHTNSERSSSATPRASPTRRASFTSHASPTRRTSFTSHASPTRRASSDAHRQREPPRTTCFTHNSRETTRGRAPGMVRGPGPVPAARAAAASRAATAPAAGSAGIADSGRSVPPARDQPQEPRRQEKQRQPGDLWHQPPLVIEGVARAVDPSATRRHRAGGRQVVPGITVVQPPGDHRAAVG